MIENLRIAALVERLRNSLWFLPAVSVVASVVAALLLSRIGVGRADTIGFGGSPEGARAILSTVAGSTITVTSLTFSLTVVALQVASSQFSPRMIGTFLADRGNQAVLSTFLATFAFSLVTLRGVRGTTGDSRAFVPDVAVAVALVLTALSVAMLVYFIHHLTQQLRVESVLGELQRATVEVARTTLPERTDEPEPVLPEPPDDATVLRARGSGYLQTLQSARLLQAAVEHDVVVRLRPRVGTSVTRGTTLAWAWPVAGGPSVTSEAEQALGSGLHQAIHLGFERTMQQDVAFGIRQLVDVAVRALSPGINDPATAIATIGAIGPVFVELAGRDIGHEVRHDDAGRVRVGIDHVGFSELLALACDQPRRYGANEPAVLVALLEMLADIAELDPHDPGVVREQVRLTVEVASNATMSAHELERVESMGRRATMTLDRGSRPAVLGPRDEDVEEPAG